MKVVIALALVVIASLAIAPTASLAAQAKTKSTGVVTAVTADTVTVKVAGKDMAFKIDEKTAVIARGASTASNAAKKEGMKGPKIGDVVKVGDEVEVTHSTVAGTMVASDVRVTKKAATK